MADIFISYKREQRAIIESLAATLRGLGFSVWFDARLSAGESFSEEINREVQAATALLACWSPEAAVSKWVTAEAHIAFGKNNLISVYVQGPDGFAPPVPFNSLHQVDLRKWVSARSVRDAGWLSVLRRVGQLTGRADVAEWGALGDDASQAQVSAWLAAHGDSSPLVVEARKYLQEAEAFGREKRDREIAARQEIARLDAEEKELQKQRAKEAERKRRARFARRTLIFGGGAVGSITLLSAGIITSQQWPRWFPSVTRGSRNVTAQAIRLAGHAAPIQKAVFSLDGANVATASDDRTARIWDANTGRLIATLPHAGPVTDIAYGQDVLATSSKDGPVRIWGRSGELLHTLQGAQGGMALQFSNDGERMLTCDLYGSRDARIWQVRSGALALTLSFPRPAEGNYMEHYYRIARGQFSRDDQFITTTDRSDRSAFVWDATSGMTRLSVSNYISRRSQRNRYPNYRDNGGTDIKTAELSSDGQTLLTAGEDGIADLWDARNQGAAYDTSSTNGHIASFVHDTSIDGARFLESDRHVLTYSNDGGMWIWDAATGGITATLEGPSRSIFLGLGYLHDINVSPDRTLAAGGFWDFSARVWSTRNSADVTVLRGHSGSVQSVAFSPDGAKLVTGSEDMTAVMWTLT